MPWRSTRSASYRRSVSTPAQQLTDRLKQSLTSALRQRDRESAAVLRTLIAAVEHAGAVPPEQVAPDAGEVARREPDVEELDALLSAELDERTAATEQYRSLGRVEAAEHMEREAATIRAWLPVATVLAAPADRAGATADRPTAGRVLPDS
jgi:uncharacterized protein YqeY